MLWRQTFYMESTEYILKELGIFKSNFKTVQREEHVFLMTASDNHNYYEHLPNCLCSSSTILIISAFRKDFITVVWRQWWADKNTLSLWKFYFTWINTGTICFIGQSFMSLINVNLSPRLIHFGYIEKKLNFFSIWTWNMDSFHSASGFRSLY